MKIYGITYNTIAWIDAPKIHTDLLWDLTLLFLGLASLYFAGVFLVRNRIKTSSVRMTQRKKELSPMVSEFLFYETDSAKEDKQRYVHLKIEIRELIKDDFNRKVLSEILLDLRKDVSGDTQQRLFNLYQDLGLDKDAFAKLKSWRWEAVAQGIAELTRMRVEKSYPFITKFINDKRGTIRKQAEIATVTLRHGGINLFLDTTKYKISEWQQLKLLDVLRNFEDYQPPRFKAWLTSTNKYVVLFALRLIKYYHQNDAGAALTELVKHKNDQIKQEAIGCIKEFHVAEALQTLKSIFPKSRPDIKISILDAIGALGSETDIPFLDRIGRKESNFTVRSKALQAINSIAPDTVMPTKGIELPEELVEDGGEEVLTVKEVEDFHSNEGFGQTFHPEESPIAQIPADEPLDTPNPAQEELTKTDAALPSNDKDIPIENQQNMRHENDLTKKDSENSEDVTEIRGNSEASKPRPKHGDIMGMEVFYDIVPSSDVKEVPAFDIDFLPLVIEPDLSSSVERVKRKSFDSDPLLGMEVHCEIVTAEARSETDDLVVTKEGGPDVAEPVSVEELPVEFIIVGRDTPHEAKDIGEIEVVGPEVVDPLMTSASENAPLDQNDARKEAASDVPKDAMESTDDEALTADATEEGDPVDALPPDWKSFEAVLDMEFVPLDAQKEVEAMQDLEGKEPTDDQGSEGSHPPEVPSKADITVPEPEFPDEDSTEACMKLLDDIEILGDEREIPLLDELLESTKDEALCDRIRRIRERFIISAGDGTYGYDVGQEGVRPFNVFEDLFRTCDTEAKLILLDEIVAIGDEKEIAFLDGLLEDPHPKIRQKAQLALKGLAAKLTPADEDRNPKELVGQDPTSTIDLSGDSGAEPLDIEVGTTFDHLDSLMAEMEIDPPKNPELFEIAFELSEDIGNGIPKDLMDMPVRYDEVSSHANGGFLTDFLGIFSKR